MAPLAPSKFVQTYFPLAQQWEGKTGIPASMYLAIIASESNWGNADNALFGIKGSGDAGSLDSATWESEGGQRVNTRAGFANYSSANAAFQGFWDLMNTPYYASALKELTVNHDPNAFIHRINQLNYATDPTWADKIQSSARSTMTPLIQQAGGGKTMGQMQDGTDPNLAIDPALVDAAINGDAPGAAAGGYVPDGNVGTVGANSPANAASPQSQMNGNDILQLIVDKIGPYASRVVVNPTTTTDDLLSPTGKTTSPNKTPTYRYTWANGKTLDIVALDSGAVAKSGTALAVLATGNSPAVREFPDGSLRQEDTSVPLGSSGRWVKIADAPAAKTNVPKTINTKGGTFENDGSGWTLIPGTAPAGASLQIHTFGDGSLHSYDPQTGQWALVQDRYVDPTEEAYKKAQTEHLTADTASIQKGLRPVAVQAFIDADAAFTAIQQAYQRGEITAQEMNDLGAQVHAGIATTIAGTTIFEQNKQAQDTATQRAQTATSLLNQRVQAVASLGSTLLSAATAKNIRLPKGQATLGIDPLQIANDEVNKMGGGQSTGNAAAAFLASVFGGGNAPTDAGGAPPPGPGTPFPTTREAVMAKYPHLASVAQPSTTQFVPPNLEQGAGGPGIAPMQQAPLTVLPPRPMSLTNARIQAGG